MQVLIYIWSTMGLTHFHNFGLYCGISQDLLWVVAQYSSSRAFIFLFGCICSGQKQITGEAEIWVIVIHKLSQQLLQLP